MRTDTRCDANFLCVYRWFVEQRTELELKSRLPLKVYVDLRLAAMQLHQASQAFEVSQAPLRCTSSSHDN